MVLCLIAAVAVLDQAAKWWAWRQVPWTKINSGGDILVGTTVGGWYASPVSVAWRSATPGAASGTSQDAAVDVEAPVRRI